MGCVLAFKTKNDPEIYQIDKYLKEKKWSLGMTNYPVGIRITITMANVD